MVWVTMVKRRVGVLVGVGVRVAVGVRVKVGVGVAVGGRPGIR